MFTVFLFVALAFGVNESNEVETNLPECGPGTILVDGNCIVEDMSGVKGDCLIATATYGSEMSSQVQMLREVRDNILLNTYSGTLFMKGFNPVYYSFSPTIAEMEHDNSAFKEFVKILITPMITILSIMTLADEESEFQVIVLGLFTIGLIVGLYIVIPITIIQKIKNLKHSS